VYDGYLYKARIIYLLFAHGIEKLFYLWNFFC